MEEDKKRKIALFRFGVISGIVSVKETDKGERESRIREVTSKEWDIPYSGRSYIGRSTVRDWLKRHGLDEPAAGKEDMRRFEAELPNDLWQSDCLHGPMVVVEGKQRKSFLFAFIDDHSRLIPHGEFYLAENIVSFTDALKKAIKKRGLPRKLYVDNGPYFRSHNLDYSCASLGIALIHCTAYRPEGKGKIERLNKTIRTQFLSTIPEGISLEGLNERLSSWIDSEYHLRVHGGTGEKPLERYVRHLHLIRTAPKNLDDYFRQKAERTVDRDRTVSLHGKAYEAPVNLVGRSETAAPSWNSTDI